MKITTPNPDEVKGVVEAIANMIETYGEDQLAVMQRSWSSTTEKKKCAIRSEVYLGLAAELRAAKYEKGVE